MFLLKRVLLILSEYHRYFKKRPGLECAWAALGDHELIFLRGAAQVLVVVVFGSSLSFQNVAG